MPKLTMEVQEPDPPFWTKTSWLQLGYGVWVNMTVMEIGLSFGFPAVTIPQLRDEASPIKVTLDHEAWIVSILTLSSPIGSILCGILMDRYGRRLMLVLCEIPMCFGWFYMGLAASARDIIIGRGIAGIGLGMAATAPRAYITEITLPNMRGVIGVLPNLFISLGLTIQAGFGSLLAWTTLCYICGCYTVIIMFSNIFLPDTPYFLLLKTDQLSNAKSNLKRFRSSKFNVDSELEALYEFRNENNIRRLSFKDQVKALFKPSSCKPYGIATVYIIFMQLAGVNVVIMWAVEMLQNTKLSINANLGNFILALTRVVFGIVTSILIYKVGRRVMALVSAIGVGVACISICVFLYVSNEKSIVPLLFFMAYIAFATVGYYNLPLLMMFELLPLQLRGLLSGICISQINLLMFALNNRYPYIHQKLGLANTMAMFGIFSLLGAVVLYFILPETKDLTLQEIEEFFNSRRPTLVSQRQVMSAQLHEQRMSLRQSKSSFTNKEKQRKDLKVTRFDKKDSKEEDKASKLKAYQISLKESVKGFDSEKAAKGITDYEDKDADIGQISNVKNEAVQNVKENTKEIDLKDEKKSLSNDKKKNLKDVAKSSNDTKSIDSNDSKHSKSTDDSGASKSPPKQK